MRQLAGVELGLRRAANIAVQIRARPRVRTGRDLLVTVRIERGLIDDVARYVASLARTAQVGFLREMIRVTVWPRATALTRMLREARWIADVFTSSTKPAWPPICRR